MVLALNVIIPINQFLAIWQCRLETSIIIETLFRILAKFNDFSLSMQDSKFKMSDFKHVFNDFPAEAQGIILVKKAFLQTKCLWLILIVSDDLYFPAETLYLIFVLIELPTYNTDHVFIVNYILLAPRLEHLWLARYEIFFENGLYL